MKILLFFYLLFTIAFAHAQNIVLNGKVVGHDGVQLPNVIVSVDGAMGESISDIQGNFTIRLSKLVRIGQAITLRCTCKGYQQYTKNIVASNEQVLDIKLYPIAKRSILIEEVRPLIASSRRRIAYEIVVSNLSIKDVWLKKIAISSSDISYDNSSYFSHPLPWIQEYEIILDTILRYSIAPDSTCAYLSGKFYENKDTAWAYSIKGGASYCYSDYTFMRQVFIEMPINLKIMKNDKMRVRFIFSAPSIFGISRRKEEEPHMPKLFSYLDAKDRTTISLVTDMSEELSYSIFDNSLVEMIFFYKKP